MGPNLDSCALTRGKCAYVAALIPQALIDKLQIIERYNHGTKRCRVLSQDDGTSSSDRRAIECPKAGNVRKTRQCASIAQRLQQQPPRQPFRRDRRPAIPGIKFGKCPRQLSKRRIHKLTTHSQRMICWIGSPNGILLKKPFRAIILPQHRIPHQKRIRGCCCRRRAIDARTVASCGRCRLLDTRSHDDHWTKCRHPETAHDTFRPMIVPFDDLELVYQSLRNSSRHIRANFRASMRRTPNWGPYNLGT